jgi:hypothetical protein
LHFVFLRFFLFLGVVVFVVGVRKKNVFFFIFFLIRYSLLFYFRYER